MDLLTAIALLCFQPQNNSGYQNKCQQDLAVCVLKKLKPGSTWPEGILLECVANK